MMLFSNAKLQVRSSCLCVLFSSIDSADILIEYKVRGKYEDQAAEVGKRPGRRGKIKLMVVAGLQDQQFFVLHWCRQYQLMD
jgi:hypothetical protein